MAFFSYTRPVAEGVFGRSFGISLGEALGRISRWNDQRVTRNQLEKLSDRELNDIGLTRSDIPDVVSQLR